MAFELIVYLFILLVYYRYIAYYRILDIYIVYYTELVVYYCVIICYNISKSIKLLEDERLWRRINK